MRVIVTLAILLVATGAIAWEAIQRFSEADEVAGEVAAMWAGSSNAPQMKAGRLKALAVSGARRSALYPELPTIGEFYPGFENSIWLGLFGPAGIPEATLSRLRSEIRRALESPEVKEKLLAIGLIPVGTTSEGLNQELAANTAFWQPIVKATGYKITN